MNSQRIFPSILFAAALVGAPAAAAYDRNDDPGSAVMNGRWVQPYLQADQMSQVDILAQRAAVLAERLNEDAVAQRNRFTWREERALRLLSALEDAAQSFDDQVQASSDDPAQTDDEFRNLVGAFYRASYAARNLRGMSFARREFQDLADTIDRLMYFYDSADSVNRAVDPHPPAVEQDSNDNEQP